MGLSVGLKVGSIVGDNEGACVGSSVLSFLWTDASCPSSELSTNSGLGGRSAEAYTGLSVGEMVLMSCVANEKVNRNFASNMVNVSMN